MIDIKSAIIELTIKMAIFWAIYYFVYILVMKKLKKDNENLDYSSYVENNHEEIERRKAEALEIAKKEGEELRNSKLARDKERKKLIKEYNVTQSEVNAYFKRREIPIDSEFEEYGIGDLQEFRRKMFTELGRKTNIKLEWPYGKKDDNDPINNR